MKAYKVTCHEGVIVVNTGSRLEAASIAEKKGYTIIKIEIIIEGV